jgi:hypothetical protein
MLTDTKNQTEAEAIRLRSSHGKVVDDINTRKVLIEHSNNDAEIRGLEGIKKDNPAMINGARMIMEKMGVHYEAKDRAMKTYNSNLAEAAAHKDKHFDEYVEIARDDMKETEADRGYNPK